MADTRPLPLVSNLPNWVYLLLALFCMVMGTWASWVTLQYFEHGSKALETDPALQTLAVAAALMFVSSEMAAFALAALLTEAQLLARRWGLTLFAFAVLGLEVCTIVAVQLALTIGADMSQSTVQAQENDLRARIAAIESGAASKRATAEKQRLTARDGYELKLSARSSTAAIEEQAKTDALYVELKTVRAQKHPTLTGLLGRNAAIAYAVARGVLISLGGLMFWGTAGALLRCRRSVVPVPAALASVTTVAALQAAPQPAIESKPATLVKEAATPIYSTWAGKSIPLATLGALSALGAAQTVQAAPAVQTRPAALAPVNVNPPAPVNVDPLAAVTPVNVDPSAPVTKVCKARVARDGVVMDTGVGEHDGYRYRRALAGVKAGMIRPSRDGLFTAVRASPPVAKRYLEAMAKAGEIVPASNGRGWVLMKK